MGARPGRRDACFATMAWALPMMLCNGLALRGAKPATRKTLAGQPTQISGVSGIFNDGLQEPFLRYRDMVRSPHVELVPINERGCRLCPMANLTSRLLSGQARSLEEGLATASRGVSRDLSKGGPANIFHRMQDAFIVRRE